MISFGLEPRYPSLDPAISLLSCTLIPRSLVASNSSAVSLVYAIKSILNNGGIMAGVSADVSKQPSSLNAANPGWRDSLFLAFFGTYVILNFTHNQTCDTTNSAY